MSLFFVRGQAKFEQKCFVFHWHLLRSVALFDFVIFFRELCQVVFTTSVVWKRAFTTFVETTCASKKIAKAPLPRSSNWKRKIVCENKFVRGKTQRHTSKVSEHWTLTFCKFAKCGFERTNFLNRQKVIWRYKRFLVRANKYVRSTPWCPPERSPIPPHWANLLLPVVCRTQNCPQV